MLCSELIVQQKHGASASNNKGCFNWFQKWKVDHFFCLLLDREMHVILWILWSGGFNYQMTTRMRKIGLDFSKALSQYPGINAWRNSIFSLNNPVLPLPPPPPALPNVCVVRWHLSRERWTGQISNQLFIHWHTDWLMETSNNLKTLSLSTRVYIRPFTEGESRLIPETVKTSHKTK